VLFVFCSIVVGRRRFWHATHDCVAPYVDIILHRVAGAMTKTSFTDYCIFFTFIVTTTSQQLDMKPNYHNQIRENYWMPILGTVLDYYMTTKVQ